LADISYVGPTFFPGQLGLNTVSALPFFDTAKQGTAIYMELYKQSAEIQKEWADNHVRPILFAATSQYQVGVSNKTITGTDDLKGLRLKTPGGIFDNMAKRYGIVPVAMSFNDAYEAMQRGIIDGSVQTLPSVKGYRLYEVQKQQTTGLRLGAYVAAYTINEKAYKKLPEDLQQALSKAGESASFFAADLWDGMVAQLAENFEKDGMTFLVITGDQKEQWFAPLKGIEEEWIKEYGANGQPARKVFEQYKKIAEKLGT
jgi:TRAP-type C4-dicarboxylate transport system substrate-binding protein